MDEQNPYRAPDARVINRDQSGELAGLGERLAAAIIDTAILLILLVPVMWLGGYFQVVMDTATTGESVPLGTELLWGLVSLALFMAVQVYPLYSTAQTWGKRVLKIQIVGLDGARLPFGHLIAKRYFPMQAIGLVPVIGPVLSIVNVLFIFRQDRRCVHDLIAGTKVVMAKG